MRKTRIFALMLLVCFAGNGAFAKGGEKCATIADGELKEPLDDPVGKGTDQWGFNYQAHRYSGSFCNHIPYFRDNDVCWRKYKDAQLTIKWNDTWLSSRSCDGDNILDHDSTQGSGAWYTSKFERQFTQRDGRTCDLSHFVKFVAPPEGATELDDIWKDEDGNILGPDRGGMIRIKEVVHDDCEGIKGNVEDSYMTNDGLGSWK